MATQKELKFAQKLVAAAIAVNASNEDVNVQVDITRSSVSVRISPDKEVLQPEWSWLFYAESPAYFSNDVFREDVFVGRCEVFMLEINKHLIQRDADGVPV